VRVDIPDNSGKENARMAVRAALLPTGLYLLVAVPVTLLTFATADASGQTPGVITGLGVLVGLVELGIVGWAGYRAKQWTQRRRWSLLAGLLVVVTSDALLLPPYIAVTAVRNAGPGGSQTNYDFTMTFTYAALSFGFDCLVALAVGWFGSLVTVERTRA
jgi:hypothetical protein